MRAESNQFLTIQKQQIVEQITNNQTTVQSRATECKLRIVRFLKRMQDLFASMVSGAEKMLDTAIPVILHFVQGLKMVIDNPAMDMIDALIPSRIPAEVVAQLRAHLGTVIDLLQLQLECGHEATLEDKIACYLQYLRSCSPDLRDALYHKTASMLTHLMADKHQFTSAEIDTMVQLGYIKLKHSDGE